jgi:MoxR-like ATPase
MSDPASSPLGFRFGAPVANQFNDPAGYYPGEDLSAAVEVELLLGMPLLLTGDPGCGKTSVAHWLAMKLGLAPALAFNVKSTSMGRDLLYVHDDLARFRDAQPGRQPQPPQAYLTLNALGKAILFSNAPNVLLGHGLAARDLLSDAPAQGDDPRFGRRHVVLIDELDKAPRDTPNDLLLEIERMRFRVPELAIDIEGQPDLRPAVVITSNSEKNLPEPFLRRCVFHHIQAPDDARRRDIVARRQHPFARRGTLFSQAMDFFDRLANELSRKPGSAELLAWLTQLEDAVVHADAAQPNQPRDNLFGLMEPGLGVLAKTVDDLETAKGLLKRRGLA